MDNPTDRIVPLDELDDFEVAEGDPDVRGWEVLAADGRKIGEVDELLVDVSAMKVRYLDVDLEEDVGGEASDRHILIPIGYARLDEEDDRIFVDSLNTTMLGGIPDYTHEPLTRDYETRLRTHYDTGFTGTAAATGADFYEHDIYDQNRFYGGRRETEATEDNYVGPPEGEARLTLSEEQLRVDRERRQAGEVQIDKHVETRHVEERVPTRHEEVVIERRPATAGMDASPRIEEDEIRVPVTEERLVVEKRAVPVEEVVVRKRDVIEEETVDAELRRERVDVREEGDVDVRREGGDAYRSEGREFGELGRGIEGDGISPEDDLDKTHGP